MAYAMSPTHQRRVASAETVIAEALAVMDRPYIAYSTGKDSTVMAELVWRQAPDIPWVYFDADCAFPESYALLDQLEAEGKNIIRWTTEPFFDTLARWGGPTADGVEDETMRSTVYRPIESLMAKYQFGGSFVGLRQEESRGRNLATRVYGRLFEVANKRHEWRCWPVAYWTHEDVWAFILSQGLEYNRVYDRMDDLPQEERRVSYWAGETYHRNGRWVWLRKHYPNLWNVYVSQFPEVADFT